MRHMRIVLLTVALTSLACFIAAKKPYGGQITCPVSGAHLGSHGPPVMVGLWNNEYLYVCCEGCVGAVRKDEPYYLAIVKAERERNQ